MIQPDLKKLLERCKLNPLEDSPRIELAEWLFENGDQERGRYVRTQLNTAKLGSPVINSYPGRPMDEAVESRLLKKNVAKWLNGLLRNRYWVQLDDLTEDEAVKLPGVKFERGMVTVGLDSLKQVPYIL